MVKRIFDRRGRNNWDEKTRSKEDSRLSERRRSERRAKKDRRISERRVNDTWADDPTKETRRISQRRTASRRSGRDRRKEEAAKPKTFVSELVNTTGAGLQTLLPDAQLRDCVSIMAIHKIGLVVIASSDKGMLGVLSERDIVRAFHEEGAAALETKVSGIMTRGVWTCAPEDLLVNIAQVMTENKMRHLPVVKDGKVVGIISAPDLLKLIPPSL